MALQQVSNRIKVLRYTTLEWAARASTPLEVCTIGIDTDLNSFKFGDGKTAWSALPWAGGNTMRYNGQLAADEDFNDPRDTGIYYIDDAAAMTNCPLPWGWGTLVETYNNAYRKQEVYGPLGDPHVIRFQTDTWSGGTWTAWVNAKMGDVVRRDSSANFANRVAVFTGNAKEIKDSGWRQYVTLADLGLTSTAKLEGICGAMADKSCITLLETDFNTSDIADFSPSGMLFEIICMGSNRTAIRVHGGLAGSTPNAMFATNYRVVDTPKIRPWRKIYAPQANNLLWSGTWSSSNITVPNFTAYNIFLVRINGTFPYVLATAKEGIFDGGMIFPWDGTREMELSFNATYSGTTLTFGNARYVYHTVSSNHSSITTRTILEIWGIL